MKTEEPKREVIDLSSEEFVKRWKENPLMWGMLYLPIHFRDKSPGFHVKILQESMRNKFFAVGAPRESAKSTILVLLRPTHGICLKLNRFIVIIQNTFNKAAESLKSIKDEIKENELLKGQYGIEIERDAKGDSIFKHPDGFRTRVACFGREQVGDIRGIKFGAYRPDLIIGDDVEDDSMVRNPELRRNLQEEFDQVVIPAGQRGVTQYLMIGTVLHDDSLIAKLTSKSHYPKWRKLLYRALNRNSKGEFFSLWHEKWSVEELLDMQKDNPVSFAKEYQNNPVSGKLQKFQKSDFRRWYIENDEYVLLDEENRITSRGKLSDCKAAISCDLAWEEKRESDYTAIMPAYFTPNSDILIDDYVNEKGMRPDELEEILFALEEKLRKITGKPVYVGFEKAKHEKIMKWFLAKAMRERNQFFTFKDLAWDGDKIQRQVTRLQPRYRQHSIFHKSGMGDLEHQLIRVPSGAHDDLVDCAQGLVQLFKTAPKESKTKVTTGDPGFDWLRNQVVKKKKMSKTFNSTPFVFGLKDKKGTSGIPAKESWI